MTKNIKRLKRYKGLLALAEWCLNTAIDQNNEKIIIYNLDTLVTLHFYSKLNWRLDIKALKRKAKLNPFS